ncbi:tRNA lysidine(34) synthetase TilS [Paenibacillus tarimensis]|uniref:tRNA lysidine(34) synthetase TilS n=1 Tax=Paenibacillus tarimensis TaxID=416012 RepID=UPI001F382661|nr:tRNA lysidine(34) synthetase TilS [Paenibacillus tarimensis]MCF2946197.1 tRNA lysidine(34) synthetase TilS [Paenibacillus tarimensis]
MKRTKQAALQEGLWNSGDTIVVAVSGGPDSTALLHVLHRLAEEEKLRLIAAHVNHGFRKEESRAEADFVKRLCRQLHIPCEITELDMPAELAAVSENPQLASRRRRYAFLHKVAAAHGASKIALAHHADDQAETVLMRLLRGTGLGGLSGMAPIRREKNVELIRPFLRMNKTDIMAYCQQTDIEYCEDSSNTQRYYLRNKLRLDVLPYLETMNPGVRESLVRLAEVSSAEHDYMQRQAEAALQEHAVRTDGGWKLKCSNLAGLHVALQRRLIKLILNYLTMETETISFERIEEIRLSAVDEARTSWSLDTGGGVRCVREYDTLRFIKDSGSRGMPMEFEYSVMPEHKRLLIAETGEELLFGIGRTEPGKNDNHTYGGNGSEVYFDAEAVRFPLTVRSRRPGDRMSVFGLNGTKKVQDMFVDSKIPTSRRDRVPLVWDAEGRLLWIPGVRRSSVAPIVAGTERLLRIVWSGDTDNEESGGRMDGSVDS